jgi:osmotically-inducible protein OsmY
MARPRYWKEEDYWPTFGGENFGGEGGPVNWMHPGEPGKFTGPGPRNYTRTDERILEDINEELMHHPMIDAVNIEVSVEDEEVTLRGNVDSRDMKRLAGNVVWSIWGVKEVHNQIQIRKRQAA